MTRHLTIPALLAIATLPVMGGAAIAPAIPAVLQAFANVPQAELLTRSIITVPALVSALTAPFIGAAADRLGARRVLHTSLGLFVLAGLSGYWLQTLPLILAGRVLLGLAIAGIFASMLGLVADLVPAGTRDRFMGWQGVAVALGGVVFVSLGGVLADFGWRESFLVYLLAALVLVLALMALPGSAPERPKRSLDSASGAPAKASALLVLLAFAFSAICLFYLVPIELPFLVLDLGSQSARTGGLAIAVAIFGGALAATLFGKLRRRLSAPLILAGGAAVGAAGYALIAVAPGLVVAFIGFAVAGFGMGVFIPSFNTWLLDVAPEGRRGRYAGLLTSSLSFGQFASPVLAQPVQDTLGLQGLFGVAAALLLVLAAAAAWAGRRHVPERVVAGPQPTDPAPSTPLAASAPTPVSKGVST